MLAAIMEMSNRNIDKVSVHLAEGTYDAQKAIDHPVD